MKIKFFCSLFVVLMCFSYSCAQSFAQSLNFKILPGNKELQIEQFKNALQKANMENYRYRTQNDTLQFNNGLKFVLFSAQDLKDKGQAIDIYRYKNPNEILAENPNYQNPVFKLAKNGNLIALYSPYYTSKNFKGK